MSRRSFGSALAPLVLLTALQARAQSSPPPPPIEPQPPDARAVLNRLHHINQLEIHLGALAQRHGQSPRVRALGKSMERDHRSLDRSVAGAARDAGVRLDDFSAAPDPALATDVEAARRLHQMRGAEFDRELVRTLVEGHRSAIRFGEDALQRVRDRDVRELLENTLPHLKSHLDLAVLVQSKLPTPEARRQSPRM